MAMYEAIATAVGDAFLRVSQTIGQFILTVWGVMKAFGLGIFELFKNVGEVIIRPWKAGEIGSGSSMASATRWTASSPRSKAANSEASGWLQDPACSGDGGGPGTHRSRGAPDHGETQANVAAAMAARARQGAVPTGPAERDDSRWYAREMELEVARGDGGPLQHGLLRVRNGPDAHAEARLR